MKNIEKARRDARLAQDEEHEDDDQNVELNDIQADFRNNPYGKYKRNQNYEDQEDSYG